jgi:hypothetical protein
MRPIREIWKFAFGPAVPPPPLSPHEIALSFAGSLLASGIFRDDLGAAMDTAWSLVIPFYQGQLAYVRQVNILNDLTQYASQPEGEMSTAEARAYVAGEAGAMPPLAVVGMNGAAPPADN